MFLFRSVFAVAFLLPFALRAHEGMWLPTLLKSIEGDMRSEGLHLSAEDIYSVNNGSIKDAVVLFGGGCTAEVISAEGLILTNHHCGFSAISSHSSLEQDHAKNGFWAPDRKAELRNPGLTATFVVRMEDVTERILSGLSPELAEAERREAIAALSAPIAQEAVAGTHYKAVVRPFNFGNSYYLIVTETFRDVRLVGAPPNAIGKFGGDTDNWMWPRHNADFSLFRIYAGPDNRPADPSDANVPFVPRHVLPVSMDGVKEGDFAMIFGFPGTTQRYLTSHAVDHVINVSDPARIAMRTASLGIIEPMIHSSDRIRLQYADKVANLSNYWKKFIGELRGLRELRTLERKQADERTFQAIADTAMGGAYASVLPDLAVLQEQFAPYATARDMFLEFFYYGPEILRLADAHAEVIEGAGGDAAKMMELKAKRLENDRIFYADYDVEIDKRVFKALLPIYMARVPAALAPTFLKQVGNDTDAWVDALYARSAFASPDRLESLLVKGGSRMKRTLAEDPAYKVARNIVTNYFEQVRPEHAAIGDRIESGMRMYVKGMSELFPEKVMWPDANSTLRLSYGKVEGSSPRDGVVYQPHTTLDGVMEKYVPGDPEFDVPERLIELYRTKDYGPYGEDGTMPVCFTSSLHTTGGNSGSPVLDGDGRLIGLNFDRSWESTMSDIQFDPEKCRNICVDIRYVLFIIDKFAGAKHLVDEMNVVRNDVPPTIDLPIHR
ncbi:MAG: S46 family peptidase [Flavobacteriales bacterium]